MKRSYYIPVSASVFPEIAGAEAVFPSTGDVTGVFVGRSSYPTDVTGSIPVNPVEKALILYSAPVTWNYQDGRSMDYPLVIEIPDTWIDDSALIGLTLLSLPEGVSAWAYDRAIFFRRDDGMRFLFRTEAEKRQRIDSLLSFTEIKDLQYLESVCGSFERIGLSLIRLPDTVEDDIRQVVSAAGIGPSQYAADLQDETRCGACLGYAVSLASRSSSVSVRIEDALKSLASDDEGEKARMIFNEIQEKLNRLVHILGKAKGLPYFALPMEMTDSVKFNGRDCLRLWSQMDPLMRQCVDFIAGYERQAWNWYGDEERFVFMRELWNQVLQPSIPEGSSSIEAVRAEVLRICLHFKNPNSGEFSFADIKSPLLQAFCIVLDNPRDVAKLEQSLKIARRQDYCLTVYGALRGYAFIPRTMISRGTPPEVPEEIKDQKDEQKGCDSRPLSSWASKFMEMLKDIFAVRKIPPKKANELRKTFCQAAQECGSEDRLLGAVSKKPGWGVRTKVYQELSKRMSEAPSAQKTAVEGDLFSLASSESDAVAVETTNVLFVDDPQLAEFLKAFLTRSLAMAEPTVVRLLKDAQYLQQGYAPGGRYAADPVKNPRDNAKTIRHYINLVSKKICLPSETKSAISRFLSERYK